LAGDVSSKLEFHPCPLSEIVVLLLDHAITRAFINPPRCISQILDIKINTDAELLAAKGGG
jgi:hypothetical protein